MRALLLRETTGPDALQAEEVPDAVAADGMALIEVHAAGVGFVDLLLTRGEYQIKPPLPFVPGIEVAGVVRQAPPGSRLERGMRVAATTPFGGFAELVATPEALAFPIPDAIGFDAAAALVINYQTAHLALGRRGRMRAGESVLVHGAAGGVGTAAIQVARAMGAGRVIAVAAGAQKRAVAVEAGAHDALDAGEDWVAGVREATDGRGVDVVVDPVGGERFDLSLRCMAAEGRLLVVGFAAGRIPTLPVNRLLLRHLEVIGVNFGGMLPLDPAFTRSAAAELVGWVESGTIAPVVGPRHALEDAPRLLHDFAQRRSTGKPVLRLR